MPLRLKGEGWRLRVAKSLVYRRRQKRGVRLAAKTRVLKAAAIPSTANWSAR